MTSTTSNETPNSVSQPSNEDPSPKKGFLATTIDELKLVVWPSRQQLFSESIAVILMVTLSAAAIAAVSRFFGWGASHIFR
ncbi:MULTISPECIES: preprotein translocase subunit SecE [Prochlorococcus]|uniref:preprotein translocase subunit SecE n=1 Tax=Prochlorococcus TaxID=1218 RepID=UPI000533AC4A|nr:MULTISPECIES: preprotein translocase subunit SecE [Prochlorococcus]KGG13165.1 Preprotein translocase subunit SecE [Prochlorococcus sp. MIT 0601]